jgi:glycosyltransferase involved in cell wall biosynthesis
VIPWRDRGRWLWEHLPPGFRGDLAFAAPEPGGDANRRRLPPYLGEFLHLFRRRTRWDDYDVIFTWELRTALATALIRRLSGKRRARWIAVGPILKGRILQVLPLVRPFLGDAAVIICFSTSECDEYARLLRLPRERFRFLPTPWLSNETVTERDNGYILALGHSNRDYPTLIRAVTGTDLPVVIVAGDPSALGGIEIPPNVAVRYNTGHDETIDLIAGATLHCIPLHDEGYSAGQTVLLRAMARGKAVVVSATSGVRDYVRNNQTAVLVPPGDSDSLRRALIELWDAPAERRRLGAAAAAAVRDEFGFERFTGQLADIAKSLP